MPDGYPPSDGSFLVSYPVYVPAETMTVTLTDPETLTLIIAEPEAITITITEDS